MNKRLFKIILIPMYLLIGFLLFCIMMANMAHYLNVFFYVITLMFLPLACLLSLPGSKLFNLAGMAGFVVLGILLPATQPLKFEFQGFNGWILLGLIAASFGIGGFIYQIRHKA